MIESFLFIVSRPALDTGAAGIEFLFQALEAAPSPPAGSLRPRPWPAWLSPAAAVMVIELRATHLAVRANEEGRRASMGRLAKKWRKSSAISFAVP